MKNKLTRREILVGGAASLLLPQVANAMGSHTAFFHNQRGWIPAKNTGSIGARAQGLTCTFGKYVFLHGGNSAGGSWQNTFGWFDPEANSWQTITPTTGTSPVGRKSTTIATNGTHLFIWGGSQSGRLNNGGLFTPTAAGANGGTWVTAATTNAPTARELGAVVYCNGKYIVWGGRDGTTYYNDGAIYDPDLNTWTTIPAPSNVTISPRASFAFAASDTKLMIWGGTGSGGGVADGFVYDAAAGTWSAMSVSPLSGTAIPSMGACWTGTQMFMWGGGTNYAMLYEPNSNSWASAANGIAPTANGTAMAFWTGSKVIVASDLGGTGTYEPSTNAWTPLTTVNGPPTNRSNYLFGYANHRVFYWGGYPSSAVRQNSGFVYYHPAYY